MSEREHIRFSAAEFAGWIRREGGMSRIMNLGDLDEVEPLPTDIAEISNWLLPVIPLDPNASFVENTCGPDRSGDLERGAYFNNKEELQIAVGTLCMKNGRESRPSKSDKTRVYYKCCHSDRCTFDVRGKPVENMRWVVYKFVGEHTCSREVGRLTRINCHANVVATWVAQKIHDDADLIKPVSIQLELQREFGVDITYDLALRARNLALEMVYGSHEASYQLLPSYLYMLQQSNSGSRVFLDVDPDGRFRHCFIAFGITISAYLCNSLRPVIVIDATHLKGKGRGVMFIVSTKDGNEQLFPLAFGIGPKECDESWGWFMHKFVSVFGDAEPLLVVSDQHKSIANAVKAYLPNAQHVFCYFHIRKNLNTKVEETKDLFRDMAYSYEEAFVDENMRKMEVGNKNVWKKLNEIGLEKWARSKCKINRFSFMTSNAAESFNSRLRWARRLPICSLLESTRLIIEEWSTKKLAAARSSDEVFTDAAHARIAKEERKARYHTPKAMSDYVYKIRDGRRTLLVDLYDRKCECGVFQIDDIPCSHAISAIIKKNDKPIEFYVGDYYRRQSLFDIYSGTLRHPPPRSQWTVPEEIDNLVVLPPLVIRQAGRPKENRIRHGGEKRQRRVGNAGPSGSQKPRARKRCGICHVQGHTRRKCPLRHEYEEALRNSEEADRSSDEPDGN